MEMVVEPMTKLKFIHAQVNIYAINLHLIAFERRTFRGAGHKTLAEIKSNQIRKQSPSRQRIEQHSKNVPLFLKLPPKSRVTKTIRLSYRNLIKLCARNVKKA